MRADNQMSHYDYNHIYSFPRKKNNGKSKYHSKKVEVDGIKFDSKREAGRYMELKILLEAGEISDLELQKSYELIPSQKDENEKVIERSCKYKADFVYKDKDGNTVVEDTKGKKTPEYVIKRKLMLERFGIRIIEV